MRRVALVTHSLNGGIWSTTKFFADAMRHSKKYEPHIILLSTSMRDQASVRLLAPNTWLKGVQLHTEEREGEMVLRVGALLTEFETQRYQPRPVLTELLNQYDIVQFIAGTPAWANAALHVQRPISLLFATLAEKERAPKFKQEHGWRRAWSIGMTKLVTPLERRAIARADCIFAISQYGVEVSRHLTTKSDIHLVVPGVNIDLFHPSTTYTDGYILSVGRLSDPRKNTRLLFSAYHQLRHRLSTTPKLVLAGRTGPTASDMAFADELGIAEFIEIHENVSMSQLAALYRQASLFALSSDEEGLGIVILEAMASGLPVVSTDCGGPSTVVVHEETGYLTPVGDAPALSDVMYRLLEDPNLRRRMGSAGRRYVEEKFSFKVSSRMILQQYDHLLEQ